MINTLAERSDLRVPALNDWVICPRKGSATAARLFCFPYAGGGASCYRSWVEEVGPELELCFIQWPGRENRIRERPSTRIEELAPAIADGILDRLDRPFAFYGHSLGAKVAFETARELRRRGFAQPVCLFVGACQAPQLRFPHPPLGHLGETEFIEGIQSRYGGVPRQILDDSELRALLIPTLRADVGLLENYVYIPERALGCAITVFGGSTDQTVDYSSLQAWEEQTTREFNLQILPGSHFFLQSARQQLLSAIHAQLS
jgi:surfactin synthase thioesterase subunit